MSHARHYIKLIISLKFIESLVDVCFGFSLVVEDSVVLYYLVSYWYSFISSQSPFIFFNLDWYFFLPLFVYTYFRVITMDPRFLLKDEIRLELDIRGQDVNSPNAINLLNSMIEEELVGIREKPNKIHSYFRTVSSEISDLQWKLSSIVLSTGEIEELAQCRSRLLHLHGRVLRLEPNSKGNTQFPQLKKDIAASLSACTNMLAKRLGKSPDETVMDKFEASAEHQAQALNKQLENLEDPITDVDMSSPDPPLTPFESVMSEDNACSLRPPPYENVSSRADQTKGAISKTLIPSTQKDVNYEMPSLSQQGSLRSNSPPAKTSHQAQPHFTKEVHREIPPQTLQDFHRSNIPPANTFHPTVPHAIQPSAPIHSAYVARSNPEPSALPYLPPAMRHPPLRPLPENLSQGWSMRKWPLRFGGSPKDLPIDEFIIRTEILARLSSLPQAALTLGLHQILEGSAASWYWIYLRNKPNATWDQIREAITRAFRSNVSDDAIRRQIMDRLQRPGERFVEFQLAIQELEVRLARRMNEQELLETLRRNMLPHIQDRLLFLPIYSVNDLQGRVYQVEELAHRQIEVQQFRRSAPRLHELVACPPQKEDLPETSPYRHPFSIPPPPFGLADVRSNPFADQMVNLDPYHWPDAQTAFLSSLAAVPDRNQYILCWNCDEMGHTFIDCTAQRIIFCYGCGAKNCVRPQCPKCSLRTLQGNARGSVRQNGNNQALMRPGEQPLHRPDQSRRPR